MSQTNNEWSNYLPWNWNIWNSQPSYTVPGMTSESIRNFNDLQQSIPTFSKMNTGFNEYYLGNNTYGYVDSNNPHVMLNGEGQKIGIQGPNGNWVFENAKVNPNAQSSLANNIAQYGGLALDTLGALGNLYMGNKMYSLAKDQFNFQKAFANRNLANSMKTYNNALADRINSRYAFEGRSQADADRYLKEHSL